MDEDKMAGVAGMGPGDPRSLGAGLYRSRDERMEARATYQTAANIPENGLAGKSAGRSQHAIQELLAMIEALDKTLSMLAARLEPVMTASPPETAERTGRAPGAPTDVSGLTGTLMVATQSVMILRARVEYLLQRIEL